MHATAAPASAERLLGVKHLHEEIDQARLTHADVRRDRSKPFANPCVHQHGCHCRSPLKLRPQPDLELGARVVTQIHSDTRQGDELGIAQCGGRIATRDDRVNRFVQAIG